MKNISQVINENGVEQIYHYKAIVTINDVVTATNEGDAGYQIDSDIEAIPGYVSHEIILISNEEINENNNEIELTDKVKKFLEVVRLSDRSIELKDLKVDATMKGNWTVYHNGKKLCIVQGSVLDDETIMKYGLEHHA